MPHNWAVVSESRDSFASARDALTVFMSERVGNGAGSAMDCVEGGSKMVRLIKGTPAVHNKRVSVGT